MTQLALAINAGSGTIAMTAHAIAPASARQDETPAFESQAVDPNPQWRADVVRHSSPQELTITVGERSSAQPIISTSVSEAVRPALEDLARRVRADSDEVIAVGHRIVHGGPTLAGPSVLTPSVREAIDSASSFAPLHNPPGLEAIAVASEIFAAATQVAVFDTTFHRGIPAAASTYAIPSSWRDDGIHRYGFHGISHEAAATSASEALGRPLDDCQLLTVHLGGGCSATAVRNGTSVATTMGLTPNEGMIMAARSGTVDPGLITYIARSKNLSPQDVDEALTRESGLLGLTNGATGDIGKVHEMAEAGDPSAQLALDIYIHSIRREIAAVRSSLDRLDALVFTGSAVTERPWLRDRLCEGMGFIGIEAGGPSSAAPVLVIPTDEERIIARTALRLSRGMSRL